MYDPDNEAVKNVTLESLLSTDELPKDYAIIKTVYKALDESGNEIGITAGVVTKGFNSGLNITIGVGADGMIHGVIVGDNTETAGLGAKAAEPEYEGQYVGKKSPLSVVKSSPADSEIEAITGATITSRGVTDAVNTVSEFYAALTGGAK
jgi:electron transport complex protein RnfG